MTDIWLPWCNKIPISNHGYGPFQEEFLGVVLHVNQGDTSAAYFEGSDDVTPNFQVHADGSTDQYLPLDWQPWCQSSGNQQYAAIETAGFSGQPLTVAQLASVQQIVAAYHNYMGMPLQLANQVGGRGFAWHGMGGNSWGGHPDCPGTPRVNQRQIIIDNLLNQPTPEINMSDSYVITRDDGTANLWVNGGTACNLTDGSFKEDLLSDKSAVQKTCNAEQYEEIVNRFLHRTTN